MPLEHSSTFLPHQKRILLAHLASFGDCLYATTIARQIKNDYPDCHLTWAIGSKYHSVINENPYVDEQWIFPFDDIKNLQSIWDSFEKELQKRQKNREFDQVFLTEFCPAYEYQYDGYIRSTTFRGYPHPITVPIDPVIRLTESEINNVKEFAELHNLKNKEQVILFECSPQSFQSFVTPEFAISVSETILENFQNCAIILSANSLPKSLNSNLINGSVLSFRENAELTKYCTLFVGCSSGITWLCTSDWAKKLPMLQLINPKSLFFASVVHDHRNFNLSIDHVIEMYDYDQNRVINCIDKIFIKGFHGAKKEFSQEIDIPFYSYNRIVKNYILQGKIKESSIILNHHVQTHGLAKVLKWHFQIWPSLIANKILKKLTRK